jgi:sugar (glycoside-pentoside-hexuronide) transporter
MFFLNVIYGMPALAVGTMFLITRIWDAVNDPIMGYIADRTRTRWGSYRPWAFFATIPMGVFLVMTFTVPGFDGAGKIIWAYIAYIFFTMSNTASIIPLGSMLAVLTPEYEERSVLASFREFGSAIGNLSTAIIVPAMLAGFSKTNAGEAGSYQLTAVVLSIICFLVLWFTFLNTKERVKPPKNPVSFFNSFKTLKGNVPGFCLIFAFFFISMITCLRQIWNMYYAIFYLNNERAAGLLLQIMSFAPFLLLYFIPKLTLKFGKKYMMIIGSGCFAAGGALFLIGGSNLPIIFAASFITGWGQVLTFSGMWGSLPDAADYGEYVSGVRAPGLVYALANFMLKLSMSIGGLLAGIVLTSIGFDESTPIQTVTAQNGIYLFNGVAIIILAVLIVLCMLPYKLTQAKLDEVSKELLGRRAADEAKT